ncbi:MAG: hypothetical protein WCW84_12395 [Sulfurimonas sp.]|jgi:hypothetical protein
MKKIVLAATLLASGLMAADSGIYVGVEYGAAKNTHEFTTDDSYGSSTYDNDYKDIKFKFGSGTDGGTKYQGTLSLISYTDPIFDNTNKDLMEFGFDIIKEFEVTSSFYPFLKIGMGVGTMTVEGYSQDKILGVSVNAGAGISYKVVDHLYLLAGVDYVLRKWQDIEFYSSYYGTTTLSTTDSAFKPYIGANYRF